VSRVAITLDEHALAELGRRAQAASEPGARTAARMLSKWLLCTQGQEAGEQSVPGSSPNLHVGEGPAGWRCQPRRARR
jgi:hypothetical protein